MKRQMLTRMKLPEVKLLRLVLEKLDRAALSEPAGGPSQRVVILVWAASCSVGAAIGNAIGGLGWAVGGALVAAALPLVYLSLRQDERERRLAEALPDFLESLARSLRSGASLSVATVEAIDGSPRLPWPLPEDLAEVKANLIAGIGFRQTITAWRNRHPIRPVTLAAAALLLGSGVGGEKARSIDSVAQTIREQNSIRQELRVSSTQARMSALVIALLPLAFLFLTSASGSEASSSLWNSPFGWFCLALGVGFNVAGGLWIRQIIKGAET